MAGIYVHIPFCNRKCAYCDFTSYAGLEGRFDDYVKAILAEAETRKNELSDPTDSVYFGGGTPPLVGACHLTNLLTGIRDVYHIEDGAEISIEANPESTDSELLEGLCEAGFNRMSIGFQSLDDEMLETLGRKHLASDALTAFKAARKAGFENISVDLIYAIPGQSLASWAGTLAQVVALGSEHISVYSLTIEDGTLLSTKAAMGELELVNDDEAADMFELAIDLLAEEDYEHYEVSNFAKPGYRCRHNLIYWDGADYLGLGAAAHSKIGALRTANFHVVGEYIDAAQGGLPATAERMELSREDMLSETFFLGLRKSDGIKLDDVKARFGEQALDCFAKDIQYLEECGLLSLKEGRLRLTRRGTLLGNEVFSRFV